VLRPGRSPLASLASLLQPLVSSASGRIEDRVAEHERLVERLTREPGYLGALLRGRASARGGRILLFVDQFEELYTLVADAAERRAFTTCLAGVADDATAPLRVLVSMRSDLLDRVAEDRRFLEDLTRGLTFLQPLGREALREALVQPVESLGFGFESTAMVDEMVTTLETTPSALPLLQFAGGKLWDNRDAKRKLLTQAAYRAMGGIAGALAAHADEVIAALPAAMQKLARTLLPRLVTPDGTRAIVDVSELSGLSREIPSLIDQLVNARLLVVQDRGGAEGPTVELVHESLINGWPTLRRWLDESREDASLLAQLRAAAKQWEAKGRPQGLLWRGEAADEARHLSTRRRGDVSDRERAFLDAVLSLASRATRIRRAVVGGIIALLLVVVAVGGVALVSVRRAEKNAVAEADRAQREAERARQAEKQVKDQLDVIRAEQAAREKATAEVAKGKVDLNVANAQLRKALTKAEEESQHAKASAQKAETLSDSLRRSNTKLEKLLADERARSERLEKERRKISSDLR
jgi:hypothetical protein